MVKYTNSKEKKKAQRKEAEANQPKVKEVPRYQKNKPEKNDEDVDEVRDEFSEDEQENTNKADGLADMMAKILGQNIGNKKIPILAKRKTAIMKEIEEDRATSKKIKLQRVERKLEQTKQLVIPDTSTLDYERQLKKLATRGVVALFNAIASAKRDAAEEVAAKENAKKEARGELGEKENKKLSKALKDGKNTKFQNDDGFYEEKKPVGKNKTLSSSTTLETESGGVGKTNWKALKDDYMMDSSLSMKNWDKESSGSDQEGESDN